VNFHIAGREIPVGVAVITLVLLSTAVVNLFTKPEATVSGVIFSALLFLGFTISEKRVQRSHGEAHVELDKFNLAPSADLTLNNVDIEPGNILVPVSTYYALYPLETALQRAGRRQAQIVVLHVRMLRRGALGEYDLDPGRLFSSIEQLLFTKVLSAAEKEGKPVRLAVAAGNDLWEAILRTAANLQSSTIVTGISSSTSVGDQARNIGLAWERMPDPRPRVTLEIVTPSGGEHIYYLGPHAPRLTPKEIDLLHRVWLDFADKLPGEELHHHDIVHFALNEVEREIDKGGSDDVLKRLRDHLQEIHTKRANS
jgi:nucleotide-binding universal stress UspA family protein